jgi:type II secretory pathway pseudopilin PulG
MLVVVSIIGVLMGILLPAVNRVRSQAKLTQSENNLRNLGAAHVAYSSSWDDQQFTCVVHNIASYGRTDSGTTPNDASIAYHAAKDRWPPPIPLGQAYNLNAGQALLATVPFSDGNEGGVSFEDNRPFMAPIAFGSYVANADQAGFGWYRLPNARHFTEYLSGRFYDPVFYAPKDGEILYWAERGFDHSYEYLIPGEKGGNLLEAPVWSSYSLSPAALFSPDVMANEDKGGWRDPWTIAGGMRTPSMSQALYPSLKTHMLEHHWLQNTQSPCNPAFTSSDPCQPYYFNHSWQSTPVTLFYDGHVEPLGVREAEQADVRADSQSGYGLWSRDTEFGENGYFIDLGYDMAETSFHILTTDGIRGRDTTAN